MQDSVCAPSLLASAGSSTCSVGLLLSLRARRSGAPSLAAVRTIAEVAGRWERSTGKSTFSSARTSPSSSPRRRGSKEALSSRAHSFTLGEVCGALTVAAQRKHRTLQLDRSATKDAANLLKRVARSVCASKSSTPSAASLREGAEPNEIECDAPLTASTAVSAAPATAAVAVAWAPTTAAEDRASVARS